MSEEYDPLQQQNQGNAYDGLFAHWLESIDRNPGAPRQSPGGDSGIRWWVGGFLGLLLLRLLGSLGTTDYSSYNPPGRAIPPPPSHGELLENKWRKEGRSEEEIQNLKRALLGKPVPVDLRKMKRTTPLPLERPQAPEQGKAEPK